MLHAAYHPLPAACGVGGAGFARGRRVYVPGSWSCRASGRPLDGLDEPVDNIRARLIVVRCSRCREWNAGLCPGEAMIQKALQLPAGDRIEAQRGTTLVGGGDNAAAAELFLSGGD